MVADSPAVQPSSISVQPSLPHRGGRIACSFCRTRRIRCNAFQLQPCSNCASAQIPCQLKDSRRGRYPRTRTKHASKAQPLERVEQGEKPSSPTRSLITRLRGASPLSSLGQSFQFDLTKGLGGRTTMAERLDFTPNAVVPSSQNGQNLNIKEGSEMLYARLIEWQLSSPETRNLPGIQSVYLGESWLLTYVVQEVTHSDTDSNCSPPSTFQLALPPSVGEKPENLGYDTRLDPEDIEVLKLRGAFTVPEKDVSDRLIQTFFEYVYPAFPIFDREEFSQLYETKQLSLLTLHSVYLLASTLCDEDVIKGAGFDDRSKARKVFLKRAKALYDVDYETNKVTLVQAVFLFSFMWNGSMDDKDMWHWLGIAISIAQAKGMHRSTKNSNLRLQDRRLWKRIWWSLYVRDRHCAVNLGRPMRIRDDDCDVEPLEESDFEEHLADGLSIYSKTSRTHVLFAISISKLSVIFGNIISTKFPISESRITLSHAELSDQLSIWQKELPLELRDIDDLEDNGFWARMLEINYNHHLILLHRPEYGSPLANGKLSQTIAYTAAMKITRVVDDFLAMGVLQRTQLQICPSLFAALTMYVLMVRGSDPIQRKLAEHKARVLLLACTELSKTWPACSWILRLFETVFKNLGAKSSQDATGSTQATSRQSETRAGARTPDDQVDKAMDKPHGTDGPEQYHVSNQPVTGLCEGETSSSFQPDLQFPPSLANIPDVFDPELLNGFSQDFGAEDQDFFPYLMEFNLPDR